jgi:hypothetical protein
MNRSRNSCQCNSFNGVGDRRGGFLSLLDDRGSDPWRASIGKPLLFKKTSIIFWINRFPFNYSFFLKTTIFAPTFTLSEIDCANNVMSQFLTLPIVVCAFCQINRIKLYQSNDLYESTIGADIFTVITSLNISIWTGFTETTVIRMVCWCRSVSSWTGPFPRGFLTEFPYSCQRKYGKTVC